MLPPATERLLFRWWRDEDLSLALGLWGDARVTSLIGGPFDEEAVRRMLALQVKIGSERGIQYWPIFLRDTGEHAGCCGLRPYDDARGILELGVHLSPSCSGRGLATEAGRAVIAHAFAELGARGLFAGHHPDNAASKKMLSKLGFRYTHDELYPATGRMHPSYLLRPPETITTEERVSGALFGMAVGDALGAPVEFMSKEQIAEVHGRVTEMMAGGPWLKGEWTDDTALALATAEAYAASGFELAAAAGAMVAWLEGGPKDVGNLTRAALSLIARGLADPSSAGEKASAQRPSAGNGSLMRAAATGLVRRPGDPRLDRESEALSRITHADPRCIAACVAFNSALSILVEGGEVARALTGAREAVARSGGSEETWSLIDGIIARAPLAHASSPIGYVLLTLERAFVALRDAASFESALTDVVNQGGDSDTNGAVAGALLGARFGIRAIPERWLRELRDQEPIARAAERLAGLRE